VAVQDEKYLLLYWFPSGMRDPRKRLDSRLRALKRRGFRVEKPARGALLGGRRTIGAVAWVIRELGGRYRAFAVREVTDSLEVVPL